MGEADRDRSPGRSGQERKLGLRHSFRVLEGAKPLRAGTSRGPLRSSMTFRASNLSIREPSGDIWITPARVDKGSLRREETTAEALINSRPLGTVVPMSDGVIAELTAAFSTR